MTDTCVVYRSGPETSDLAGGSTDAESAVLTVPCAVVPNDVRVQEQGMGAVVVAASLWRIHVPAGTDVRTTDRIVQTSVAPNRVFEVLSAGGPRTREAKRRVVCRAIA